jgi:hypothetical protein
MIKTNQLARWIKLLACALLVFLQSCGGETPIDEIEDPELVAVAFFDALYNERDVEKAAKVCSPQLARIILHYRSPSEVGRHLFNMSYDTVTIKPDDSGVKVREQFKDSAIVVLYFDGYYDNNRFKDVKRLKMIQRDGKWVLDKILKDPF